MTGATGTVGSAVVEHLLRLGQLVIVSLRDLSDSARIPIHGSRDTPADEARCAVLRLGSALPSDIATRTRSSVELGS